MRRPHLLLQARIWVPMDTILHPVSDRGTPSSWDVGCTIFTFAISAALSLGHITVYFVSSHGCTMALSDSSLLAPARLTTSGSTGRFNRRTRGPVACPVDHLPLCLRHTPIYNYSICVSACPFCCGLSLCAQWLPLDSTKWR